MAKRRRVPRPRLCVGVSSNNTLTRRQNIEMERPPVQKNTDPQAESSPETLIVRLWLLRHPIIAVVAIVTIAVHLVLRFALAETASIDSLPLKIGLIVGGMPLVVELMIRLFRAEFGSDLLAGISIVTSVLLR